MDNAKVYTVNGAASGSSTSLPDWLIRKRAAKGKGKREIREHVEGTIDLIQHFEFPEASNRIRTTRDGHHAMATGTYKPQIHVYDLDQLSIKFERHTDAENVDFIILSDDWTKSLHLQNDREMEGVSALASRADGLSLAVGTKAGRTLLYDLRAARPFATKDQGYGLPVHCVSWVEGGSRMAGDGLVVSADKKVVKIWDRNSPSINFASVTPSTDINHLHHVPGSGMIMLANEGIQMTSYYIPQLGPAPRWCSFLDNITEEMEEQTVRNVYEDYKFVERSELDRLGLTHLIGTPTLKPYMHGFFLSLKLYDAARLIANPFAYSEHRERMVRNKLEKLSESRIRSRGAGGEVKVNKALAEKIQREEKRAERRREKEGTVGETEKKGAGTGSLLSDPRFAEVFENPDFEVDTTSREFGLLNPSTSAAMNSKSGTRVRTAVEEEDEESERASSDGLGSDSEESNEDEMDVDSDSSREGDLSLYDPRARPPKPDPRIQTQTKPKNGTSHQTVRRPTKLSSGPRLTASRTRPSSHLAEKAERGLGPNTHVNSLNDGGFEMSFVPSGRVDSDEEQRSARKSRKGGAGGSGGKVERFGA
ncbi:hypothetical protein FRC08_010789, partial [Ceratobasidium sp. 394]